MINNLDNIRKAEEKVKLQTLATRTKRGWQVDCGLLLFATLVERRAGQGKLQLFNKCLLTSAIDLLTVACSSSVPLGQPLTVSLTPLNHAGAFTPPGLVNLRSALGT